MAAGLGCSTSEIYPQPDADLAVVATWGSNESEKSWNGAPLDAAADALPTSGVRVACHPSGCFLGLSASRSIEGPALQGDVSDAVLSFDGADLESRVTSSDTKWKFSLDALASSSDGSRFALGGRFTGVPDAPFGSGPSFSAKDGAVVMTGDAQAGITDAVWLVRLSTSSPWAPDCCENAAERAVVGGLALVGPDRIAGAARYRDEIEIVDDTLLSGGAPGETFTGLYHGINDNKLFRWGLFFDVDVSSEARTSASCRVVGTAPDHKEPNISFEALAAAGAGQKVLYAGQYMSANAAGAVLSFAPPGGANPVVLPSTPVNQYAPFVARVTLGTSPALSLDMAAGLELSGALEAVAMHEGGDWIACGTVTGDAFGDAPASCKGLKTGSWLVAYGAADLGGCVPLDIAGRCRAAAATKDGFVLAGVYADGTGTTLVELGPSRDVLHRRDRSGLLVSSLGVLGNDILVGGSFTDTLDKDEPRGGTADWDLFAARWITP